MMGGFCVHKTERGEIARPAMPDDKTKTIVAHPGAVRAIAYDKRKIINEREMMGSLY
jgi:hypothetical protein